MSFTRADDSNAVVIAAQKIFRKVESGAFEEAWKLVNSKTFVYCVRGKSDFSCNVQGADLSLLVYVKP